MNAAGMAVQHDALVIFFFDQRKALSVRAQTSEAIEKLLLGQLQESGDAGDFLFLESHIARPLATCRAALALIKRVWFEESLAIPRTAVCE